MIEIKDRIRELIGFRLYQAGIVNTRKRMGVSAQILSIPEIAQGLEAVEKGYNAKVDREAGLPIKPTESRVGLGLRLLNEGWVKELKND